MKASVFKSALALVMSAALLFAGCTAKKEVPTVILAALKPVDENAFYTALSAIDIEASETKVLENTAFKFTGYDTEYPVIISIDAKSDNGNFYSYTKCEDEKTARELFDYYFNTYSTVLSAEDFKGAKGYEIYETDAYLLISGAYDDIPYHDALYLKGDTLVVAFEGAGDTANRKEIDAFLTALEYPLP